MEETNQPVEAPKKNNSCLIIGLIMAGVLLILVVGGYFGLAWVLRNAENRANNLISTTAVANEPVSSGKETSDSAIVGTWKTDCLIPDPNSPWAEQHTFTFKSDGTANHKRSTGDSCAAIAQDNDDSFKYTIPSSGKINLTYVSSEGTMASAMNPVGQTIYDIYQISGSTLLLGHGFRGDNLSYTGKAGVSEADRIDSLNEFLVYKKQ